MIVDLSIMSPLPPPSDGGAALAAANRATMHQATRLRARPRIKLPAGKPPFNHHHAIGDIVAIFWITRALLLLSGWQRRSTSQG
jgi:hypothetical protein